MTSSYVLLSGIIAASYIDYGEAISCYICNSKRNDACADPMIQDWNNAVQCPEDLRNSTLSSVTISNDYEDIEKSTSMCSKVDYMEAEGKKYSVRACVNLKDFTDDPCQIISAKHEVNFCGYCGIDFCNSTTPLKLSSSLQLYLLATLLSISFIII